MDYLMKKHAEFLGFYDQIEHFANEYLKEIVPSKKENDIGYIGSVTFLGSDRMWGVYAEAIPSGGFIVYFMRHVETQQTVRLLIEKEPSPSIIKVGLGMREKYIYIDDEVICTEDFKYLHHNMSKLVEDINKSRRTVKVSSIITGLDKIAQDYIEGAIGYKTSDTSRWYYKIDPKTLELEYEEDMEE